MSNATAEPIKLKAVGDKHTMDVASCAELPFGKYKEYEFVGRDGSVVRVPKASTERQLGRLSLTAETVIGRRVTLKRDASGDPLKPFWGIYLEDGSGAEEAKGAGGASNGAGPLVGNTPERMRATATTQSPPPDDKKPSGYALYKQITAQVLKDMPALYAGAGIELDAQAIAAISATVFIQASRNGH